jgi:hypothetical protein
MCPPVNHGAFLVPGAASHGIGSAENARIFNVLSDRPTIAAKN